MELFDGFNKEMNVEKKIIQQYCEILPQELLKVWEIYGFGSLKDGYLKIINPDNFQEVLKDSYFRSDISIPIFATAFGDIITWEENKYLRIVKYNKGVFIGISSGFEFFWEDVITKRFQDKFFDIEKYEEAVLRIGKLEYDECFGYVPLLGLGGNEKVENLKKVKIREHIEIITQLSGKIE